MLFFAMLVSISNSFADQSKIRKVMVATDQIVTVRTAVGVATIIQVPDRPLSIVVGDSDAFKIEYLDKAITIKPLRSNARSNLYIYTDWRRFDVQLTTTGSGHADFVVYLTSLVKKTVGNDSVIWRDVYYDNGSDQFALKINRIGFVKGEFLLIDFVLSGDETEIDPKSFWLTQAGASKTIHRLALSSLNLSKRLPVAGLLQVKLQDINRSKGLRFEIRSKKSLGINLSKEVLWR